jgi:hypothetical protein
MKTGVGPDSESALLGSTMENPLPGVPRKTEKPGKPSTVDTHHQESTEDGWIRRRRSTPTRTACRRTAHASRSSSLSL